MAAPLAPWRSLSLLSAFTTLCAAPVASAQELHLLPGVREIAADTLTDAAITSLDSAGPVIFYNPQLLQRYGPVLGRFLIAHEYGHIYHHHTRAAVLAEEGATRGGLIRRQELEADCYATARLAGSDRAAVEAALRFFTRLGPFSFDGVHPTGAQRVGKILECLPEPPEVMARARNSGETGMESGPVSGIAERVRFTVATPALDLDRLGRDVALWIDGQPIGRLSNMRSPTVVAVNLFPAGLHSYRLSLDLFGMDQLMQFRPNGTVVGLGYIAVKDGDAFVVRWSMGRAPQLVPSSE